MREIKMTTLIHRRVEEAQQGKNPYVICRMPSGWVVLGDMSVIGDALLEVTSALRINYEIQGNAEPALHAHIIPRYADEPDEQRRRPIWFGDRSKAPKFDHEHDQELMGRSAHAIQKRLSNLENPK